MSQIIEVPEITGQCSVATSGAYAKKELMLASSAIKVTDIPSRDAAKNALIDIRAHLKQVEADRQAVKAPFLVVCAAIDSAAKAHVFELKAEVDRLSSEAALFEVVREREAARLRAEEQRKADEALRIAEQARLAAVKAAADAEAARLALDSQDETKPQESRMVALAEELDKEEAAEAALEKAKNLQHAATMVVVASAETKMSGVRMELDVTVTDVKALYAAYPAFVKLEPQLAMIKAAIKNGTKLPGVTATERPVLQTRSAR